MKTKASLLLLIFPLLTGCSFLDVIEPPSKDEDNSQQQSGDTNEGGQTLSGGEQTPSNPGNEDNHDNNNNNNDNNNNDDNGEEEEEYVPVPSTDKTFAEFFNYESKVEIELDFTNQAITKLRDFASGSGNDNFEQNEMYHPCTAKITVNGKETVIEECGARMKGNTSRNLNFVNDFGYFDINNLCHFKISFSQTFDDSSFYYVHNWESEDAKEERDDRKYGGMKKLDLKWNRNYDNTFTKEAYVLNAFREEGVVAQHSNLVQLTVKSESDSYTAIYQALEAVDKRLLKAVDKNDNKGDLYKCCYTDLGPANLTDYSNNAIGLEAQYYRPKYNLKTNEDDNDFKTMKDLIDVASKTYKYDGVTADQYYESISKIINVDNFLKFSALCWAFGMPDDLRNNYNNYYVYFSKNRGALFIPYDNDRCLGLLQDWPMDMKGQTYDSPYDVNGNFNQCPLVLRLISGGSNNSHPVHQASKDKYFEYCKEYAAKYLDNNKFQEFTNQFYYAPSKDITSGGSYNDSFPTYASAKKATLN